MHTLYTKCRHTTSVYGKSGARATALLYLDANDNWTDQTPPSPGDSVVTYRPSGVTHGSGWYYRLVQRPILAGGDYLTDATGKRHEYIYASEAVGDGFLFPRSSSSEMRTGGGSRLSDYHIPYDFSSPVLGSMSAETWTGNYWQGGSAEDFADVVSYQCDAIIRRKDWGTAYRFGSWHVIVYVHNKGKCYAPGFRAQAGTSTLDVRAAVREICELAGLPWKIQEYYPGSGTRRRGNDITYYGATVHPELYFNRTGDLTPWDFTFLIDPHWYYDTDDGGSGYMFGMLDAGIIPGQIRNAVAQAYAGSLDGLPEASANSLQNVIEIASTLTSATNVVRAGQKAIVAHAKSAARSALDPRQDWLKWRYVYNTTKLDLEDYRDITNRLINLSGSETFKTHAYASAGIYTVKVTETWESALFDVETYDTRRLLETYGFKLSAYNLWDMIPYSFIVDWFADVGGLLEHAEKWARRREMRSKEIWFSCSGQLPHGYFYMRWSGLKPTMPPVYSRKQTSTKTLIYRLADTISIFT